MTNCSATPGNLYIVATPIGNLEDISLRAISTLKKVDYILAEDTRHSAKLLSALGIQNKLYSLHQHNEHEQIASILSDLNAGKSLALVSDAGTPLINDPGYVLVRSCREQQINVTPIPGCCAFVTALCAAGVPCDNFIFCGFLPAKTTARTEKLKEILSLGITSICYESTHRLVECLDDIHAVFGEDYEFVLAKELTKTHEYFLKANHSSIKKWLNDDASHIKGEFVLIFPGVPQEKNNSEVENLLIVLLKELSLKQAVKIATSLTGLPKNELYRIALDLNK